jgi:hypothetical protein
LRAGFSDATIMIECAQTQCTSLTGSTTKFIRGISEKMSLLRTLLVIALVGLASCYPFSHEPPGGDYVKFAELAPGYPAFAPGLGTVYVQPSTRPVGPYRSYDRSGKLIATIYMVPEQNLEDYVKMISNETVPPVDHWTMHPVKRHGMVGLDEPHWHITLWHVPAEEAALIK